MKRSQHIILNICIILTFYFLSFYSQGYPMHLFTADIHTPLVILVNCVIFLLVCHFFLVVFTAGKSYLQGDIFGKKGLIGKKEAWTKIGLFAATQIAFDFLCFAIRKLNIHVAFFIEAFLIVVMPLLAYFIFTRNENTIWKSKKYNIITFSIFGAVLVIYEMMENIWLRQYLVFTEKYLETSESATTLLRNIIFHHERTSYLVAAILIIALMVCHITKNSKACVSQNNMKINIAGKAVFSSILYICLVQVVFVVQLFCNHDHIIHPYNDMQPTEGYTLQQYEKDFQWKKEKTLYIEGVGIRTSSNTMDEIRENLTNPTIRPIVYKKVKTYILEGPNGNPVFIDKNGIESNYYIGNDSHIYQNDGNNPYICYTIDGKEVCIYPNHALCFYEDGKPTVWKLCDIARKGKSNSAIKLIEKGMEDGYIFLFSHVVSYMQEYDADFIAPYIERYAKGDFTAIEKSYMDAAGYRYEFIEDFAKESLK